MKQINISGNRKEYSLKGLKFNYDGLNDLLYVYKQNSEVYSTVMVGEFHLEFSRDGEVVGVEILKASDLLKEYDVSKSLLNNLDGIKIRVVVRSDSLIVFLVIGAMNKERSIPITTNNLESPIMQIIN
ncbi:MAG TPA: DUF2283 domain-containing protein [Candidatus Nanoarchaeia archaeon]|nr:DUF2283 domain-containing protein [Candidatus Nanoarchaeia archaeon]